MSLVLQAKDLLLSALDQPVWVLITAPIALATLWFVLDGIRNVYFHPLSHIPGPRLAAFTQLYFSYYWVSGHYPHHVLHLHSVYGPIVRLSPYQVSFSTATSWKTIYGHVSASHPAFLKSAEFYNADPANASSVANVRDPAKHARLRKLLSNAFSAKSVTEQEPAVHAYMDDLVARIGRDAAGPGGAEMVHEYNKTTFDIIGDLAFGSPFGAEGAGWVKAVLDSVSAGSWLIMLGTHLNAKSLLYAAAAWLVVPTKLREQRETHQKYSREKMEARMAVKEPRKDFLTRLLAEKAAGGHDLDVGTLTAQSAVLVVAGSETTATWMSGVTYHLCHTPRAYKAITDELRGTFAKYEDITAPACERLPYLNAVVHEGLRIFPPVPVGTPRDSPGAVVDGVYVPAGFQVFTTSFASTRAPENFARPNDFAPERWLSDPPAEFANDKRDASQPFLLGSRVCLGRNLAMVEMRLMLAKILWAFDMKLVGGTRPGGKDLDWERDATAITLWIKPQLWTRFTKREGVELPPVGMEVKG
ncbi:cytochrome P450 [Geopyxis carbonaria]|nr:cytochrome P450 [Geopyxis carbonaria]